ncbi:acetate kinase [bacterium BMS3Abin05]|nr:acetate kinase [bacterium BMS3Abin05]GBE28697.1 acetate kinase [bacterium BMS3Bbin03]HDL78133.1 acetate kinase [Bacteroidota bacterium]HDZ12124.1 acetate kinase [Bacteroidota bacterium]
MKIMVLNCGSSSVKYQLIDSDQENALAKGVVERIGMSGASLKQSRFDGDKLHYVGEILDHTMAIENVLAVLMSRNHGVIKDKNEIDAVGHRVVHGGEKFEASVLITREVMDIIKDCIDLAPLHNPHNIKGIQAAQRLLPDAPQVAVFDTAFHQNMPQHAYMYALPYSLYRKYTIRRYGFHGTSHRYVSHIAAEMMGKPYSKLRIITVHLGNGCSMAAIKDGYSIDTSMGFTPVEGLVMGTRSGDIDPAIILHIMGQEELTLAQANTLLNKHSGLWGISGISSDAREIIEEAGNGNKRAQLALDVMTYRIKKYIGAYTAAMGGLDVLVFTAGIGENSPVVREMACKGLELMGLKIDPVKNKQAIKTRMEISKEDSKAKVLVIPTNEELVIARDTRDIVLGTKPD